jgi:hypothetical protein
MFKFYVNFFFFFDELTHRSRVTRNQKNFRVLIEIIINEPFYSFSIYGFELTC